MIFGKSSQRIVLKSAPTRPAICFHLVKVYTRAEATSEAVEYSTVALN